MYGGWTLLLHTTYFGMYSTRRGSRAEDASEREPLYSINFRELRCRRLPVHLLIRSTCARAQVLSIDVRLSSFVHDVN